MYNFDYVKASSVADATAALGGDAQAISGGQTLIPTLKARLGQPSSLVDLSGVAEMSGITAGDGSVTIGGAVTHHAVSESGDVPASVAALAAGIGDPAVRHRGTIGGSVANNDPSACYPSACLGLGATIHTSGGDVAADDYFRGMFDTALGEGQIVTGVTFPTPAKANYQKFVQPASRFALVGVFVSQVRFVCGGVSSIQLKLFASLLQDLRGHCPASARPQPVFPGPWESWRLQFLIFSG